MTNESTENHVPEPGSEKTTAETEQPIKETPVNATEEAPKKASPEKPPAEKKPAGKLAEKSSARKKASPGAFFAALGLLLLEILLPVILTAVLLWWVFANFNLWSYDRTLVLVVFAAGMVAISLLLTILLDSATRLNRKKQRAAGVRFTSNPLTRLIKLVLGGVVLPLALFAAANLVPLSAPLTGGSTAMNYIISTSVQPVKRTPPDEVGSMALESKDPSTKVLSIQALQEFQSPQALGQLIRLASEDKDGLSNPRVADALSNAIASYGKDARDPLIVMFNSVDPAQAGAASTGDAYTRYFADSIDRLKAEIQSSGLAEEDRDTHLAQIDAAAAQLKTALKDLPAEEISGDPRPSFALKTFLAMDLKEDPDLLAFAKTVAQDKRYPASLRGEALLLIAKLGTKDDLDALYPYLKETDSVIQNMALQAIVNLQAKLNGTEKK